MIGLVLALTAGYGVFLLYTAAAFGWAGLGVGPAVESRTRQRGRLAEFMSQAGLTDVRPAELGAVMTVLAVAGSGLGYALFGGSLPAVFIGGTAAVTPVVSVRNGRARRRDRAGEAWPRMLEEIRLQATTMGRSVPQALLAVGLDGPPELRTAFVAAQQEWLVSTDFERSLEVLKEHLADPTADSVCETLLIAHEVGGADLDRRLAALIDDRLQDLQGRKDALAKQAGARFARWFVVVVPIGMALAGLSIGDGRAAYGTTAGQIAVLGGLTVMALCWVWAGRIMRLPSAERVFYG